MIAQIPYPKGTVPTAAQLKATLRLRVERSPGQAVSRQVGRGNRVAWNGLEEDLAAPSFDHLDQPLQAAPVKLLVPVDEGRNVVPDAGVVAAAELLRELLEPLRQLLVGRQVRGRH